MPKNPYFKRFVSTGFSGLGISLIEAREHAGLTQRQAVNILGFANAGNLSKYEHGENLPSIEVLFDMAQTYNTTVDKLTGFSKV